MKNLETHFCVRGNESVFRVDSTFKIVDQMWSNDRSYAIPEFPDDRNRRQISKHLIWFYLYVCDVIQADLEVGVILLWSV